MDNRKVYVPWPVAMEIADNLDRSGFAALAREIRAIVWNEVMRLYMLERSSVEEYLQTSLEITSSDLRYTLSWMDEQTLRDFKADTDGKRIFEMSQKE